MDPNSGPILKEKLLYDTCWFCKRKQESWWKDTTALRLGGGRVYMPCTVGQSSFHGQCQWVGDTHSSHVNCKSRVYRCGWIILLQEAGMHLCGKKNTNYIFHFFIIFRIKIYIYKQNIL